MPQHILSVLDVADQFESFFFDVYGTIWSGKQLYPGITDLFRELKKRKKNVHILSNASAVHTYLLENDLRVNGAEGLYDHAITSGDAFQHLVANGIFEKWTKKKDFKYYIQGMDNPDVFAQIKKHRTHDISTADIAYVTGRSKQDWLPRSLDPFIPILQDFLNRNIPIACANPDYFALSEGMPHYTAGSLARWYEENGGTVFYIGKPYADIFKYALNITGATPKTSLMIGDTVRTDILGGKRTGMKTLLITKTGITNYLVTNGTPIKQVYKNEKAIPDFTIETL